MKKRINSRTIATTGLLLAVEIILQLLTIIIPGFVNINLSLIPITLGAIMFGPIVGGFLGFMSGVIVLCSPNTIQMFMQISPVATVFTCLTKTLIAGVVVGFTSKLLKKYPIANGITGAILVPLLNTFIFSLFCFFCFKDGLIQQGFKLDSYGSIFTVLIGINFLFEILINVLIVPLLYKVILHLNKDKIE